MNTKRTGPQVVVVLLSLAVVLFFLTLNGAAPSKGQEVTSVNFRVDEITGTGHGEEREFGHV